MSQAFYANGKLLLSAEYLVLNGALALAVPLNKGQKMTVSPTNVNGLHWQAYTEKDLWFEVVFDHSFSIKKTTSKLHAQKLQSIINEAVSQNPHSALLLQNKKVITTLEFNPLWGWGSSSTLLELLSKWLNINPYQLLDKTFGGSGYDVACASSTHPIFYQRFALMHPVVEKAHFNPKFITQLGVVWLNQKQTSSGEVKKHLSKNFCNNSVIDEITAITKQMASTQNASEFANLMHKHEQIIGEVTNQQPVKKRLFEHFNGSIKSLGAWGGDFILFLSNTNFDDAANYFAKLGYGTVFRLSEVIIK